MNINPAVAPLVGALSLVFAVPLTDKLPIEEGVDPVITTVTPSPDRVAFSDTEKFPP